MNAYRILARSFSRFPVLHICHLATLICVLLSLTACGFAAPNLHSSLDERQSASSTSDTQSVVAVGTIDRATPQVLAQNVTPGPLRPQQEVSLGSGIFARATYSDGLAPITDDDLLARFTRTDVMLDPTGMGGCWIAHYAADQIWLRAGSAGAYWIYVGSTEPKNLTESAPAGILDRPTTLHGYLLDLRVSEGEWICVVSEGSGSEGLYVISGPDLYYWFDSYCYRKLCD